MIIASTLERCVRCYSLLVMVTVPNPPSSAPRMEWACRVCENLAPVDKEMHLYKRPSDWPKGDA